jgi:hypothetical protein
MMRGREFMLCPSLSCVRTLEGHSASVLRAVFLSCGMQVGAVRRVARTHTHTHTHTRTHARAHTHAHTHTHTNTRTHARTHTTNKHTHARTHTTNKHTHARTRSRSTTFSREPQTAHKRMQPLQPLQPCLLQPCNRAEALTTAPPSDAAAGTQPAAASPRSVQRRAARR